MISVSPSLVRSVVSRLKLRGEIRYLPIQAYSPDQPRDAHGRWGSGGEEGLKTRLNSILSKPDNPKSFYVFRVQGKGENGLAGRNGADLLGVAKFLLSGGQEFTQGGDSVALYHVQNPSGTFGDYSYNRGGAEVGQGQIGLKQDPIKWGLNKDKVNWYSFPSNVKAVKIKEVSLASLRSASGKFDDDERVAALTIHHALMGGK
jgi:hypothetical protein